ncbi:hypothetical protein [Bradyrhizobium sp. LA2.1]|uniref:hypothetical protein n=1 Tax=Bradyrhizobium sp. LA2.1 TaxID=3156376 RepID=UPI003399FE7E
MADDLQMVLVAKLVNQVSGRGGMSPQTAAQLDGALQSIGGLEDALYALIDAVHDSGAPIFTISNAVRQCETALRDRARALGA